MKGYFEDADTLIPFHKVIRLMKLRNGQELIILLDSDEHYTLYHRDKNDPIEEFMSDYREWLSLRPMYAQLGRIE